MKSVHVNTDNISQPYEWQITAIPVNIMSKSVTLLCIHVSFCLFLNVDRKIYSGPRELQYNENAVMYKE